MIQKHKTCITALFVTSLFAGCSPREIPQTEFPIIAPTMIVDFSETVGKMKPVNGINNGPKSHAEIKDGKIEWSLDKTEEYLELGIPFVRTHDTEYPDGKDCFIDIHCIFPNPEMDADDESSYHFEYTDQYIANIQKAGAEVLYRLGESIAITTADAVYQYPPQDPKKWAEVCAHVIAHYNDGWKDGFNYNIQFWEIWNEPDQPRQWIGDVEKYYELYQITAARLKKQFPDILIGAAAPASVTKENLQALLNGIQKDTEKTPLDFLDWHIYTDDPAGIISRAELVRKVLDENGYEETLSVLGEWNYVDDWDDLETTWKTIREPKIAAFYAACLISMQQAPVDIAMYYDGSLTWDYAPWCGLYDGKGKLLPGYNGFQQFSKLIQLGTQAQITSKKDYSEYGIYACAASEDDKDAVLITNLSTDTLRFQLYCNSKHQKTAVLRFDSTNKKGENEESLDMSDVQVIEIQPGEMILIEIVD